MPGADRHAETAELLQGLRAEPSRAALLFDIDGTLAPIAPTPREATVPERTRDLLAELSERFGLVACISGRRATDARTMVGIESIAYAGNHGLEYLAPHEQQPEIDKRVAEIGERIGHFAREHYNTDLQDAGVRIEDKQAIWAFHWRGAPDETAARARLEPIALAAREQSLNPHWGRKVLEIRPPIEIDKGTAVAAVLEHAQASAAMFAGDDTTDLDAFRELRRLKAENAIQTAVCVGVTSPEGPEQIERQADLTVEGTEGLYGLLQQLAA